MKTKSIVIAGLALLVGGLLLLTNRPESPTQAQTVVATSKVKAERPAPQKSYGGSFRIASVKISDKTQPTVQPKEKSN